MINRTTIAGVALALSSALATAQTQPPAATPYDGLKKTVAVDQFLATESTGGGVTAEGMTALLTAALVKDGRFVVVERPALAGIQAEQALGQAGAVTTATAARPGQLLGASAIVLGVVTKYQPVASGGGISLGGLPMGSFFGAGVGIKNQSSMMEISLRLIDTTTGQVISTSAAQGTASSNAADVTLVNQNNGLSVGAGAFLNTPIGQAGEQAIVKAVEQIAAGMRTVPWSALVIDSSNGLVYVNAGAERNVQAGMLLNVYQKGKVLTDPATGVVLDVELQNTGTIRIVQVREKLSTAKLESGELPARGHLVKLN
jgi:curli biogenesis system outer membrane secretion channel CsgG